MWAVRPVPDVIDPRTRERAALICQVCASNPHALTRSPNDVSLALFNEIDYPAIELAAEAWLSVREDDVDAEAGEDVSTLAELEAQYRLLDGWEPFTREDAITAIDGRLN